VTAFCEFVTAAVARYKTASGARPRVSKWEIWNEPNLEPFWLPTPSATQYVEMANAVRTAILAEDPTAEVSTAGLAGFGAAGAPSIAGVTFLQSMLTGGLDAGFNIFGLHPYCDTRSPTSTTANNSNFSDVWRFLDTLARNGRWDEDTQLWLTEFGWDSDDITEATQATYLASALGIVADYFSRWCPVTVVFCDYSDTGSREGYGIRDTAANSYAPKDAQGVFLAHVS
jgi:hypothetical protein